MKAYLDSNILISLEDDEINYSELINSFKTKPQFIYSYVHIQELLEAKEIEILITRRTKTIKHVTNNLYIYPDGTTFGFKYENPDDVIQVCQGMRLLNDEFRSRVHNFNIDRELLLNKLGISKLQMNNIDPSKVVDHLNQVMSMQLLPNFHTMLLMSGQSVREQIASFFNFLDFLGFWTDKQSTKSNIARIYDASHTYFSSACDYFISNDKRTTNKAKAAFNFYNIKTEVLSFKELIKKNN